MSAVASTRGADEVRARLERCLGRDALSAADGIPGALSALPLACPQDEESLCELLRLAGREGWRVLPIGFGSKLGWCAAPEGADLLLSTRRLAGVVAYEPGDGTLTARAGSTLAELARAAEAGGHHLTPAVPGPASLGGALAAGQSGIDRTRCGPARHHVLGMRVALAGGVLARTGGRLVKNVTGFDLHRLYCGSHGTLCVIVEATMRLFPAPGATAVLRFAERDLAAALARARALRALPVQPLAVVAEHGAAASELATEHAAAASELFIVLAGREEAVAWECERVLAALGPADVARGGEARAQVDALRERDRERGTWPDITAGCRPSAIEGVLARLAPRAVRLRVQPAIAVVDAWLREPTATRALEPAQMPEPARALMRRLRAALDPAGVFARRALPG